MREMKDSGIPWVGKVPPNWEIMPNKYLMHKVKKICPVYNGENILSLTMQGVIIRDFDLGGKMPATFDGYQIIYPGNLLMCLFDYDVTPRCIGLIKDKGLTSPAYSQFVMNQGADAHYYYYYYLLLDFTKELLHLAKNLRHSFTEEQLGKIKVPVPPVHEQHRIADFLDAKCARIDFIRKNVEAEIEELKQYKQSVITEAVTKGLDKNVEMKDSGIPWNKQMPKHWGKSKIKHVSQVNPPITVSFNQNIEIGYAPMEVVKNGYMLPQSIYLSNISSGLNWFQDNDIVLAKVTPCFENGNIAIAENLMQGVGVGSSELFVIRVSNIKLKYLFYYLQNEDLKQACASTMTGAGGLKRINPYFFKNMLIPIPPKKEQQQIVDFLDSKCAKIDSVIQKKQELLANLDTYKKSLIYEYVTGKKEVPAV